MIDQMRLKTIVEHNISAFDTREKMTIKEQNLIERIEKLVELAEEIVARLRAQK